MKEICSRTDFPINRQNVHTPFNLCNEMLGKLSLTVPLFLQTTLTTNLEFVEVLIYDYKVKKEKIWFVTDCAQKAKILNHPRYKGVNVVVTDYLTWRTNMKFDVIAGNPPYQDGTGNTGDHLWDKFVVKSISLLKDGGHLCYVHPSAWRGFGRSSKEVRELLKSKQIHYLELHNEKDGLVTFGAETRYDWYILQNQPPKNLTTVVGQDGTKKQFVIENIPFIPNGMFDEIFSLMAKDGEEKCQVLRSASDYHTQQEWVSKESGNIHKYPCVYSIAKDGTPTFHYSSRNDKGHYGIPKVIFAGGRISSANYIVDSKGEYGMTEFAKGVVDIPQNLPKIAAAMRTEKFKRIMEMCAVGFLEINKDILATFRKDFYKQFVDDNGNPI